MKEMISFLTVVLRAIVRAFLPAAFETTRDAARDTCEDARPQPELKARLQNRVRATWGRAGAVGTLAFCALLVTGCGTRVFLVPEGEPVRLRKPIKRAAVWVMDENGRPVASKVTLPAGWYALPVPDKDDPQEVIEKPISPPVATPPDECPQDENRVCVPFHFITALP